MKPNRWMILVIVMAWAVLVGVQGQAEMPKLEAERQARKPVLSTVEIRDRLRAIDPLPIKTHGSGNDSVRSRFLCFCLHKGPASVRALRRQAARHFQKGIAALQTGHEPAAIEAFTQAIQLNPRDALAYINRGLAYGRTEAFAKAQADFSRALDVEPQQGIAYYARGLVAVILGQPVKAKRDLRQAADFGNNRALTVLQQLPIS